MSNTRGRGVGGGAKGFRPVMNHGRQAALTSVQYSTEASVREHPCAHGIRSVMTFMGGRLDIERRILIQSREL